VKGVCPEFWSGGEARADDRRRSYTSLTGANWALGRFLLPQLGSWAKREEGLVLDFGCGDSPFRREFHRARGYVRADIAPKGPGSIVVDGVRIPIRDESIDCVLVAQVLGDVPDLVALLREFQRVLRPGGCVVIFETMAYPEHDLPHDYFRVLPHGVEWAGELVGLREAEIVRLGGFFTRVAGLLNPFVMGVLRAHWATRPLGVAGTVLINIAAVVLDGIFHHPSLAPDYLARMRK